MNDGKLITVLGRRGQGKTLTAYSWFLSSKCPSFWVSFLDPVYIIPDRPFRLYRSFDEFTLDKETHYRNYMKLFGDDDFIKFFARIKSQALNNQINYNLFIDEFSAWANASWIQDDIEFLIKYGRPLGINLILIAQRPVHINPTTMSQADCVVLFHIDNYNDYKYLQYSYGMDFRFLGKLTPTYVDPTVQDDIISSEFFVYRDYTTLTRL